MPNQLDGMAVTTENILNHSKDDCPFCKEEEPPEPKANHLGNSAATLRGHLNDKDKEPNTPGSQHTWKILCTDPSDPTRKETSDVRANPHHLIPGNASLKPNSILDVMEKDRGQIKSDIGYDVNKAENGIWLPTIPQVFYAGDKIGPKLGRWGHMTTDFPTQQYEQAELAMRAAKTRQFHDAHPEYSNHVSERLNELHLVIVAKAFDCPLVTESNEEKAPPPYGLVARLDALSKEMAKSLEGAPSSWRWPKFTSRQAEKFSSNAMKAI